MAEETPPQPEIDPAVARRLFKEYVQAKKAAGQSTKGLSYGTMLEKLEREAARLKQKLGDDVEVRFEVRTIDGKVRLRALKDRGNGTPLAVKPPAIAPPVAPPSVVGASKGPPPLAKTKGKAPVVPAPVVAPPAAKPSPEPEELDHTEIDHDDLEPDESDTARLQLEALLAEEAEPLPPTAGRAMTDMTASQKVSFATLGDIARRMQELAEQRDQPARAAAAAADAAVLAGESSGEADIRAVASSLKQKMEEAGTPAGAPAGSIEGDSIPISIGDEDDAPAVGFGGASAVAVVAHASIERTREAVPEPATSEAAAARRGFPLGLVMLLLAMVGAGYGWVTFGDQLMGRIQAEPLGPAATPASSPAALERVPGPSDPGPDLEPTPTPDPDETGGVDLAGTGEPEPAIASTTSGRGKKPRTSRDAEDPPVAADTEPAPQPVPQPADGAVDCRLTPDAPGCPEPEPEPEPEWASVDKLSQDQLRDGFQLVKADAQLCGRQYGAEKGTKVSVKVSIDGKTGGVSDAEPLEEYTATALGKCVADALRRASFPPFARPGMGVTWTIKM